MKDQLWNIPYETERFIILHKTHNKLQLYDTVKEKVIICDLDNTATKVAEKKTKTVKKKNISELFGEDLYD